MTVCAAPASGKSRDDLPLVFSLPLDPLRLR
jgi:hypothetical protein